MALSLSLADPAAAGPVGPRALPPTFVPLEVASFPRPAAEACRDNTRVVRVRPPQGIARAGEGGIRHKVMYAIHMLNQRLQILLSAEQRSRLEAEARERRTSVASLIREAIDARFGPVTREDRLRAVGEIRRMGGKGTFVPPEELNRAVEEERGDMLSR